MELILNKAELTKAVAQFAADQTIDADSIDLVISWQASSYNFPPNISELLSHCDIKAVVKVKDRESSKSTAKKTVSSQ